MKFINVPDLSPKDDTFTQLELMEPVDWIRLSGLPGNALERKMPRIRLSRYRAALQAVATARRGDVLISHHPLMSNAVAVASRFTNQKVRHIAWAFNFTNLPTGTRLQLMSRALARVERFVVFSKYEKTLYPQYFGLDEKKFTSVLWTQDCPSFDRNFNPFDHTTYVCAIGGEGRDIDLIMKAAGRFTKRLRFVIITRPHMIPKGSLPDNVDMLCNVPPEQTWAIANNSAGVLVPLTSDDKCCGHITIVSAKLLGLPIVTTRSVATEEYVAGREAILQSNVGDLSDFSEQIEALVDRRHELREMARAAQGDEANCHSRKRWSEALNSIIWDT